MNYIGIDLAWTYKNETGVCILDDNRCIHLSSKIYSDDDLIDLIISHQPCVVSIDAPLVVTNEKGGRSVDSMVMRTQINGRYLKLYATSRSYMLRTFEAIRGQEILNGLESHGFRLGVDVTETYPTGIFLSLFPDRFDHKYKLSSRKSLVELLKNAGDLLTRLSVSFQFEIDLSDINTKKAYKHYEDLIDGILCAVNSYYFYNGRATVWEDKSGLISLPKPLNL